MDRQTTLAFDRDKTLRERFEADHAANPDRYEAFKRAAIRVRRRGRTHFGAKGIGELIRYFEDGEKKEDGLKVNNSYLRFYADLLVQEDPSFAGFFETRKRTA